jgi:hypothetical protein
MLALPKASRTQDVVATARDRFPAIAAAALKPASDWEEF